MSLAGFVSVAIIEGRNLAAKDSNGYSDPYCVVSISGGPLQKTPVIKKSLNPKWGVSFTGCHGITRASLKNSAASMRPIKITVWDKDRLSDDFMGEFEIPMSKLIDQPELDAWFPVQPRPGKKDKVSGDIHVHVSVFDPNITPEQQRLLADRTKFQEQEIGKMWEEFVRNRGAIKSKSDLAAIIRRLRLVESLIDQWDINNKQNVSPEVKQALYRDESLLDLISDMMMKAFDTDGDGSISFEELTVGLSSIIHGDRTEKAKLHFRVYDKDRNGKLTRDELRMISAIGAAAIRAGFIIGIRMQMDNLKAAGLSETDFYGVINAIEKWATSREVQQVYADCCLKSADKDGDGSVSLEEYIEWVTNEQAQAEYKAAIETAIAPHLTQLTLAIQKEMQKILFRVMC